MNPQDRDHSEIRRLQVVVPDGEHVVRLPVEPGEVVILPFGDDAEIMMKAGNGNLGIKSDDTTVVLQGFAAAQQSDHPVIVENAGGVALDVSAILAAYEPYSEAESGGAATEIGFPNAGAIFQAFEGSVTLREIAAVGPISAEASSLAV
jgi:hypothetical protein